MNQVTNLIEQYKAEIIPVRKSFDEMLHLIASKADVEKIHISDFTDAFVKSLYFNARNAITNNSMQLSVDDFEFCAYSLMKSPKNNAYWNSIACVDPSENSIYIVLEKKTGFILTNHSKLHLELVIAQGISPYDYENDTDMLVFYLSCIDRLAKHEY